MRMLMASAAALLSALAAYSQDIYRVGWQQDGLTYFGEPFTSTRVEAEARVNTANQLDPGLQRFLVTSSSKLPPPGVALEEMPSTALRRAWLASLLAVAGSNGLDIASSYGKRELNPLLQGGNGSFDMSSVGRKAAIVSVMELPQLFLVRRSPRRMRMFTIVNFALSAALVGVSAHNFGVPAQR